MQPREILAHEHKKTCIKMLIAALCYTKNLEITQMSLNRRMNKLWHIHTTAIKRNKLPTHWQLEQTSQTLGGAEHKGIHNTGFLSNEL